jgi:acyl-CoA hydrolase
VLPADNTPAITGSGPAASAEPGNAANNNPAQTQRRIPDATIDAESLAHFALRAKTALMEAGRRAEESITEMTEIILPSDSNALGSAFGGKIMQWIDVCAAITAQRHTRKVVVTASMDDLHFHAPIKVGEVVCLKARVEATFTRSLEVYVDVHSENPVTGEKRHCCSAMLTFVALDEHGKPTAIPPLAMDTPEARARQKEAEQRRASRLANRQRTIQRQR